MSDSVRPHGRQPTRLPRPWDSPGKNTGVGCHFLLQCMKVKSESEVAQSCSTLSDPMDCSLQGSSVHGIFQARVLEWVAIGTMNLKIYEKGSSHYSYQSLKSHYIIRSVVSANFSKQILYLCFIKKLPMKAQHSLTLEFRLRVLLQSFIIDSPLPPPSPLTT